MLTNLTCRVQYGTTVFSMRLFLIVIHRQSEVNHLQNHTQWYWRNQRNGKLTAYLTLGGAIGSCIISSNGLDTTTYTQAANWRSTLQTPVIWWMSFTKNVQICYGSRGIEFDGGGTEDTEAVWMFHCALFLHLLLLSFDWISAQYECHWHGLYHLSIEVELPRALNPPNVHHWAVPIGCGTYGFVRLHTQSDCFILCFPFLLFSDVLVLPAQEVWA